MAHSTRHHADAKAPPEKVDYSRTTPRRKKPRKPDFPLWLHATGQWCKKIRGRCYYFGKDKDKALAEYLRVKDDLEAGRTPRAADPASITLMQLCNHFLTDQIAKRDAGEITPRTFLDYHRTCELLLERLGKTLVVDQIQPDDLMALRRWLATKRGPATLGNEVGRIRVVFNHAFASGLVDRPVRFGNFKRPARRVLRRQRAAAGPRLFEAGEIKQLLDKAGVQLKVMILLGTNAGLGNADCARLEFRHLDLTAGWLDYPRPKTGIDRRCPLWPETVAAMKAWITQRKEPSDKAHAHLVFITKYRGPWSIETSSRNPISAEFRKLLVDTGVARDGLSFYALRHTFQTVADEIGDYLATRRIMGHVDDSMSATYRERFPDERLKKVTDHVHDWLYGEGGA